MSNLSRAFSSGKAVIPFIMCGDPDLAATQRLIAAMSQSGADMIELGLPFSDPVAEDVDVMESGIRALDRGVTTDAIFSSLASARTSVDVPLVLVAYANCIFSYGIDKFADKMRDCGIDALIIKDVPYEEREEFSGAFKSRGIDLIYSVSLAALDRAVEIARAGEGFIDCRVNADDCDIDSVLSAINDVSNAADAPCVIDADAFDKAQLGVVAKYADGVVVSSSVVKLLRDSGDKSIDSICEYILSLKRELNYTDNI